MGPQQHICGSEYNLLQHCHLYYCRHLQSEPSLIDSWLSLHPRLILQEWGGMREGEMAVRWADLGNSVTILAWRWSCKMGEITLAGPVLRGLHRCITLPQKFALELHNREGFLKPPLVGIYFSVCLLFLRSHIFNSLNEQYSRDLSHSLACFYLEHKTPMFKNRVGQRSLCFWSSHRDLIRQKVVERERVKQWQTESMNKTNRSRNKNPGRKG